MFEIREGTRGASAKVVAALSFTNGRVNLDDVTTVKFHFKSSLSGTVVTIDGAVESSAGLTVSVTLTAAHWTTNFANIENWALSIDLNTASSRIVVPENSAGFKCKFYPHPALT